MLSAILKNLFPTTRGSKTRRRTYSPLSPPERLEDRSVPAIAVTHIDMLPIPDNHLTSGSTVTVAKFHVDSTNPHGAISTVVVDDVRQGALDFVSVASLSLLTPTGRVLLDSSPVTHPALGGLLVFNNFGYVPVANGADFEVDVTGKNLTTPYNVHAEVGPSGALGVAFSGRYLGTLNYTAHPQAGDNHEEPRVPNLGGVQRTLYNIETLADTTVTAADRQKTVWQGYVQSSDWRAFFRCIRFISADSSQLDFIRTGSVWVEIAPGTWDRLMTVRPTANGQLIFTIYTVGRTVATGGDGAHIRVTVDANPSMVGTRNVDLGFYFSTFPYSGRWSFASYERNVPPPAPVVTHGMLSASPLFYAANPGTNVALADVNIGGNEWSYFDRLDATVGTGTFAGASNFKLWLLDDNYNVIGGPIGTVTYLDNGTVRITGIGFTINWSHKFRLTADLTNSVQLNSVIAQG